MSDEDGDDGMDRLDHISSRGRCSLPDLTVAGRRAETGLRGACEAGLSSFRMSERVGENKCPSGVTEFSANPFLL